MKTLIPLLIISALLVGTRARSGMPARACSLKPITIGVIDTGFGYQDLGHDAPLCQFGHKDFTVDQVFSGTFPVHSKLPLDFNSHGTNVVGLINEYASKGDIKYCFVIIKYWSNQQSGIKNVIASADALKYANNLKLDVINYSGGGSNSNEEERIAAKHILDRGALIVAAAGNEGDRLDGVMKSYFPAMYDPRIVMVGSTDGHGHRADSSNYGSFINAWEVGVDQVAYGIKMSGTSQATAIVTGKRVSEMNNCDK